MTKPGKIARREPFPSRFDDAFEDFRTEMENMMRPWPHMWHFPRLEENIRVPEQIDPAKVAARMNNGILAVDLPKKTPSKKKGSKVQVQ